MSSQRREKQNHFPVSGAQTDNYGNFVQFFQRNSDDTIFEDILRLCSVRQELVPSDITDTSEITQALCLTLQNEVAPVS